jgi:hypothetical protein
MALIIFLNSFMCINIKKILNDYNFFVSLHKTKIKFMPAREMFFTFNTKVELNKENVKKFKEELENHLYKNEIFEALEVFETKEVNKQFLKEFIKEMKNFYCDGIDEIEGRKKSIYNIIRDVVSGELKEPQGVLGIRYLYDEWEYEGAGYNDHYYYTFCDDKKMIKEFTKKAQEAVNKLAALGVNAKLVVED